MSSTTPNIGLTLPTGTEGWKRSVINGNFTILDTKIGAVGNTSLQSQINTLSSHTVYLSHYNGNNITILLPNYSTALCTALVSGVGSSAFAIYRSGNSITFHHIAGHDAVTNSLSATVVSNTSATISTTGTNIQLTAVLSNLA